MYVAIFSNASPYALGVFAVVLFAYMAIVYWPKRQYVPSIEETTHYHTKLKETYMNNTVIRRTKTQ